MTQAYKYNCTLAMSSSNYLQLVDGEWSNHVYMWKHDYNSWYNGGFNPTTRVVHGNGLLCLKGRNHTEDVYIGQFRNGEYHGYGAKTYSHARCLAHIGYWKHDIRHGPGIMLHKGGNYTIGVWKNGRLNGWAKNYYKRKKFGRKGFTAFYCFGRIVLFGALL